MKSIKAKILTSMIATVAVSLLLIGGISCVLSYTGTLSAIESSMAETSIIAAERVSYQLQNYMTIANETGTVSLLSDSKSTLADKQALLQQKVDTYSFQRYNLLDASGNSYFDGKNYSQRNYFQEAMKGNACVSEPLVSAVTGEITVIVSAPVWKDGAAGTAVVGVVYFVPKETFLNDIVSGIQISEGGSAYMLDADGYTIAHKNMENVRNMENTVQDAKSDNSLAALAAVESEMVAGHTGFDRYTYGGVEKLIAYAPVPNTNGWSIAVNAPISDFTDTAVQSIVITVVMLIVGMIASTILSIKLATGIGVPVKACVERLKLLAEGDLDTAVPEFDRKDEIGELVSSMKFTIGSLKNIIGDIDGVLGQLANGNFITQSHKTEDYRGNYANILASMNSLRDTMNDTLTQIVTTAEQVDSGSKQVADGAQELSQGATEQASATEELAATINEINESVAKSGSYAAEANQKAIETGNLTDECNAGMKELVSAMNDISHTSEEIGRIIKTIEDIAFQTNILALNAAVEAARAGAAGKGFAVVADEVRNLAGKSAEASKNTAALIEASMRAVSNGADLVDNTARNLQIVADHTQEVGSMVEQIAANAREETISVQQISDGIDQISSVVQTNSATAEQSAAASEELSGQAAMLKNLVGRFILDAAASGIDTPVRKEYSRETQFTGGYSDKY